MTHITHFRLQPANVQYWDYYILCRCNTEAAIALQRMEFWDGTKEDGNIHAEDINDVMEAQGQTPTQDTSRWIYKSADELHWELMGVSGERRLPGLLNFLIKEVKYLESRHHPTKGWDRRMQYQFQSKRIQDHINYLGYIISYFGLSLRRLCPVFYAIELLTSEKCRIEDLNAEKVLEKIETLKDAEKMPHFLKSTIEKFYQSFIKPPVRSFRNFAEWKLHSCGMQSAEMQNATGGIAESISQNCGSNNILHIISDDIEDRHKQITYAVLSDDKNSDTPASFSLQEMIAYVQANGYSVSQEPSTTKETLNGTAQPTYLAGDHRANGNDLAAVHPLSNLQGAARDPLGVATDQHQGDPSRTGTHTGQLADRVTTSDMPASSDAVTLETPLPSQANNDTGKNLPAQKTLSDASTSMPLSQTEVTTQNEVVQASNGQSPIAAVATRNPDEEHATLSRSGEDVPAGGDVPQQETPPEPGKGKRTRTPEDETIKARVERVFAYFDTLKQETTGKPEERYARTKAAAKEIKDTLLPCGPTELKLRKVYLKLWNTPPSKGSNFHWKDHMTIKAVCGQYESVMLAVDADEKVEAEKKRAKQALESIVKSPPILVQAEDDYVFDLERVRGNRGRRSAS